MKKIVRVFAQTKRCDQFLFLSWKRQRKKMIRDMKILYRIEDYIFDIVDRV